MRDWEPIKEQVDFITAINSDKMIYPVEYFDASDEKELKGYYAHEDEYYKRDGLWRWLGECVVIESQRKYINGQWYIED